MIIPVDMLTYLINKDFCPLDVELLGQRWRQIAPCFVEDFEGAAKQKPWPGRGEGDAS